MREFTRNNQPHYQQHSRGINLTVLVHDAVPQAWLAQLRTNREEQIRLIKNDILPDKELRIGKVHGETDQTLEDLLARKHSQEHPFRDPRAARVAHEYLLSKNGVWFTLHSNSVMSNHLHSQFDPILVAGISLYPTDAVVGMIKGGISYAVNKALGRSGALWADGYYDRYIRSAAHFNQAYYYNVNNPVKAGIVERWEDHPWTYGRDLSPEY